MANVIFMGIPKLSGNYTHFQFLAEGMEDGFSFKLVSFKNKPEFESIEKRFFFLEASSDKEKAKKLIDFIDSNEIDILIPMNSPIAVSIIPYLPQRTKVVQIVNSDTPRVYKYVTEHIEYISQLICISDKQHDYLFKKLSKEDQKLLKVIPHGVKENKEKILSNKSSKLKIGFLGRVHQGHKNVLVIPDILKNLDFDYEFHLIGDGPDKPSLLKKLVDSEISIVDHGFVPNDQIGNFLKEWDILLFPSIVEGFGLTLIEAMNMGVVPLANLLPGITDMIIEDEVSGFLVNNNKVVDYVRILKELNQDRAKLHQIKENAKKRVKEKFNLDQVISEYQKVFKGVLSCSKKLPPKDFKDWTPYTEYKPSVWNRILNKINKF